MSTGQHLTQQRPNVAYFGLEQVAFGTLAASMVRDYIVSDSFDVSGLAQGEVENLDQRPVLFATQPRVRALKSASRVKFRHYGKVAGSQLTSAASPATPYLGILLKAALGGEASGAGSTVASATGTTITVGAGHGARFAIGTWIGVGVGGVIEPCRVVNVATDTLTLNPAPSSTPANGQLVINSYCYYPTQTNATSLSAQFGYLNNEGGVGGADLQWQFTGCAVGDLGLQLERGGIFGLDFDLMAASPSAPSALSLVSTLIADAMAGPFPMRDAQYLIQPTATSTKTQYPLRALAAKIALGMQLVPELGSTGVEGVVAAFRAGPCRPFSTVTAKFHADTTRHTDWINQTQQQVVCMIPLGSGTTKRWIVVDWPCCNPVGWPKVAPDNQLLLTEMGFEAALDVVAGANATTDLAQAPLRVALI